jgi:hypothetical protein
MYRKVLVPEFLTSYPNILKLGGVRCFILITIIMRSLHDVHEINAFWDRHVCLSVIMIQIENHWTDLDKIWYERYAIADYHKIVLFSSL